MKHDNWEKYGTISRILHGLMAAGFLFMFATAVAFNIDEKYFSLMSYHKSVGVLLLILGVIRLIWAIINHKRRPPNLMVAKAGHSLLYVLMLGVPLLGALRQYASAKGGLDVFGITLIPAAPQKIESLVQLGNQLHGKLGFALFVVVAGHVAMAVWHQIKGEKIINRMFG